MGEWFGGRLRGLLRRGLLSPPSVCWVRSMLVFRSVGGVCQDSEANKQTSRRSQTRAVRERDRQQPRSRKQTNKRTKKSSQTESRTEEGRTHRQGITKNVEPRVPESTARNSGFLLRHCGAVPPGLLFLSPLRNSKSEILARVSAVQCPYDVVLPPTRCRCRRACCPPCRSSIVWENCW